jgi:hypothetical protein
MTPRRRHEYLTALGGALALLAVIGLVGGTIGVFLRPYAQPVNYTEPTSPGGGLVFDEYSVGVGPTPVITLAEDAKVPMHYLDVRDPKTGRHVVGIDRAGSLHPDWRRKFKLLRRHCLKGCCAGDVREGRRSRVGH